MMDGGNEGGNADVDADADADDSGEFVFGQMMEDWCAEFLNLEQAEESGNAWQI